MMARRGGHLRSPARDRRHGADDGGSIDAAGEGTFRRALTRVLPPLATAGFIALWLLERRRPLRREVGDRGRRIVANLELGVITGVAIQLIFLPVMARAARLAERGGLGILHRISLPAPLATIVAVVALDYSYYWWHRMLHRAPLLWRFHLVHHSDNDLDLSTALRFHCGEWVLSTPFRAATLLLLGPSEIASAIFETTMALAVLFHHSNVRLPIEPERTINMLLVTPRMHGIHHSIIARETDSNYGTIFSGWDRLHSTARLDVPQGEIVIGLPGVRDGGERTLGDRLLLPFDDDIVKKAAGAG
jgi:sterol desaturase/sphingolipid hydroxylase (fatty acid hydroxylase superfamily)